MKTETSIRWLSMADIWEGDWITTYLKGTKPNPGAFAFRYTDSTHGIWERDWNGEPTRLVGHVTEMHCSVFEVTRFTPKGFYVLEGYGQGQERWVGHAWRKKLCHLSQADAQVSFIARKKAQIRKLKTQLGSAERALYAAEQGIWSGGCPPIPLKRRLQSDAQFSIM